jgi:hypothetical protein
MPREIHCSQCSNVLTVADDAAVTSWTCPDCQARINEAIRAPRAEAVPKEGISLVVPSAPERLPRKWMGRPLPSPPALFYHFLLPVLTIACLVAIAFVGQRKLSRPSLGIEEAVELTLLFFGLHFLAVTQVFHWFWQPAVVEARIVKSAAGLSGAGCLFTLAILIFLFGTCTFLANM